MSHPPNWNHVDDATTRSVLEGTTVNEENIQAAIEFAEQCLQADQENDDVGVSTYHARATALTAADMFWQIPCIAGTVANLRVFWSI